MAIESDLMGVPVVENPDAVPNAHFYRGYEERDWKSDPYGQTGYAAPYNLKTLSRPEVIELIQIRDADKAWTFDVMEQHGIPSLDQKYTNTCHANAVVDGIQCARVAAGLPHVPLSSASVAGPVSNFRNWRGSPAGVGGWPLQDIRFIAEHGIAPQSLWPNADLNPKYNELPEVQAERQKYRVSPTGWLDLPPNEWEPLWTCVILGYACPVAHNAWRHATNAVKLGIRKTGGRLEIMTLVRNSGYGRDQKGLTWLPESFGRPSEAQAVRHVT